MMITLVNSDDGDLAGYLENDVHSDYLEDVDIDTIVRTMILSTILSTRLFTTILMTMLLMTMLLMTTRRTIILKPP